jgi:carboxymethylenebutenolidase
MSSRSHGFTNIRSVPAGLLAFALVLVAALIPSARADEPAPRALRYTSGGKEITVERFLPSLKGKFPTLLLLHGADGLGKRGDDYRAAARFLTGKGYAVLLVHYFDRTGTKIADRRTIDRLFLTWVATIHDGIVFARKQPFVDTPRLALVGYSLGAYLSLSAAALAYKDEHKVAAIVEYFGGLPKLLAWRTRYIPPTLIFHGGKDDIVPVQEARDLVKALDAAGVPHEVKIYPNEGHGFSEKIALEAIDLGDKFLAKHMGPKVKPKSGE